MKWIEVVVKTSQENEDIVSDVLYQAGAQGLAIEDPNDILELSQNQEEWDFFDINISEEDLGNIIIKAYYSESSDIKSIIDFIREKIENNSQKGEGKSYGKIVLNKVDEKDWSESWKKYYKPKRIGKRIIIKPSWEDFKCNANDLIVELDPGMAFGTGTHETTIMCTEAIESYMKPGDKVYDVGCGSGILSIVAAKLGASKVLGIDMDPNSVRISKENIIRNGVDDTIDILEGNLLDLISEKANVIVSNIIAEIIVGMSLDIKEKLTDNGIFIASGIILDKIDLVKNALLSHDFKIIETKIMNEWACIVASRN
ncbi:50S ribosomal protein L11 methyltransferase [Wansuia hejianensis]|uniref:Ribosomal protein L11 methyltransferase n=1 Tax=Wansuia hejianensis TaxID=2763667 RepID=A0A926IMM1_9FIRM|nr:50S ribosomal protein L11 methyltransferase [Wansuia hejianensis]MBC8590776.1 50S ribosomal protein L11 methyltransferase [Wansuia hejianensis]